MNIPVHGNRTNITPIFLAMNRFPVWICAISITIHSGKPFLCNCSSWTIFWSNFFKKKSNKLYFNYSNIYMYYNIFFQLQVSPHI